jgi:hypothetical protein
MSSTLVSLILLILPLYIIKLFYFILSVQSWKFYDVDVGNLQEALATEEYT